MRWHAFAILAYVFIGLQMSALPEALPWKPVPNFVLLAVVFLALNAPREPALLGCFLLGLAQDICTIGPIGTHAFAYGVAAMFIVSNQSQTSRDHPLTHFVVTLMAGLLTGVFLFVHDLVRRTRAIVVIDELLGVLYTAGLAILVLGILQRMRGLFGFKHRQATLALRGRFADI